MAVKLVDPLAAKGAKLEGLRAVALTGALSGSRSRGRLRDGRAINGDGLSHRVSLLLRRGRILRLQRQREGGDYRGPIELPLSAA